MWWIAAAKARGWFTLFGNFGGNVAMGGNWQEAGVHYGKSAHKADSVLVSRWSREVEEFPVPPLRVGWGSGREGTLSLTGKKNGSRTECRSTSTAVALCGGAISSWRDQGGATK